MCPEFGEEVLSRSRACLGKIAVRWALCVCVAVLRIPIRYLVFRDNQGAFENMDYTRHTTKHCDVRREN
jgi:hypothetical protein